MESNKDKRNRRSYDAAFKQNVLQMVKSGRSVPDFALSLGVTSSLFYPWIKLAAALSSKQSAALR